MSQRDTGLTFSPQTVTASPAANMFLAAFMSRSWLVLHSGHVHCLLNSGILASTCPQFEQRLLDGYHLSILISSRPYQWALYSSCRKNSDQLASEMDLDRWRFFCMFFTDNVSTAIAWFSRIKRVESLCRKSLRVSAIFACKRATFLRALARLFEPFCFLLRRRCSTPRRFSYLRRVLGAAIFSPFESTAKWLKPRSIPTLLLTAGFGATQSSHRSDTKYLPAGSLLTLTVDTFVAFLI